MLFSSHSNERECVRQLWETQNWGLQAEWPDAKLKSSPKFSKGCPKSNNCGLTWKVMLFNLAQKFTMHLGYFWKKPRHQELSKIAQSGHTDCKHCTSMRSPSLMIKFKLLQVMMEYGVKKIVFSSSATVYGDPQYLPVDEKHPTGRCTNPYGKTKFFMEEIIKDQCTANSVRRAEFCKLGFWQFAVCAEMDPTADCV